MLRISIANNHSTINSPYYLVRVAFFKTFYKEYQFLQNAVELPRDKERINISAYSYIRR